MATYTNAFDNTFLRRRDSSPATLGTPGVAACADDVRLQWLTPSGYCNWTFEAAQDLQHLITAEHTYLVDRVYRDTRRRTDQARVVRSGTLDETTRRVLATIYSSVAVFLLTTDAGGVVTATPVRVEPGEKLISQSRVLYDGIVVQFTLPVRHSFRTV